MLCNSVRAVFVGVLFTGSGVSACFPEFDPRVKTLTGSSVRARSATGQVTKSLGKKTVNFDINGIAAGVNMKALKISKPIVSAGKMVRSGRSSAGQQVNVQRPKE